jgi:hypothetical protein
VISLDISRTGDYASPYPNKYKREFDMAEVSAPVKPAVKTEQALREQRLQIYCKETKGGAPCTPGEINKALGITDGINLPSMNNRDHNFATFVKQHFLIQKDMFSKDFIYSWPEFGVIYKKAYQALKAYSRTLYGAVMIKNILQDHKIPGRVPFRVRLFDDREAGGFTDFIQLPSEFPYFTVLNTGDIVDPLAIIHHEFGHTRYYSGHKPGKLVTLQDEREAVIWMENAARMFNQNEPRYAYYNNDKKNPMTINIITGEFKGGIWATDKADPRIFVKPK